MKRNKHLSRRQFLGAAGAAAAGLALPRGLIAADGIPSQGEWDLIRAAGGRHPKWGRITAWTPIRTEMVPDAPHVGAYGDGEVIPVFETLTGTAPEWNSNNPTWHRVRNGYIYTATVHIIDAYHRPSELEEMPETEIDEEPGFWAEVVVPETLARTEPSGPALLDAEENAVKLYYSSVHRVIDVELDGGGYIWYLVSDDKPQAEPYYALARHLRVIPPGDLEPIHPGIPDKHMRVDLANGRIELYEGDALILSSLQSSGGEGYPTPEGEWAVVYKQPSRHMYSGDGSEASGGDVDDDAFDLYGVPFNTFFTTMGHAIHGTWWHGDYGRPRSHGCLNVPSDVAKFIWRWVEPHGLYSDLAVGSSATPGTPVLVE